MFILHYPYEKALYTHSCGLSILYLTVCPGYGFGHGSITRPSCQVHACNPSTQEAEAGDLRVRGQPGLHSGILIQTKDLSCGSFICFLWMDQVPNYK
jgi:hypothetical protein